MPSRPSFDKLEQVILQPKRKQAGLNTGDWASYEPVNFTGIDSITFRVAAATAGGSNELRKDGPEGALLGTATVPATGSLSRWQDVTIPAPADKSSMGLFLVFKGTSNFRLNFFEVNGKGLSPETRPTVDHRPGGERGGSRHRREGQRRSRVHARRRWQRPGQRLG